MAEPKREEEDDVFHIDAAEDSSPETSGGTGDSALTSELAKLRGDVDELQQLLIRRQADFENYRKRVERDRQEEGRRGVERLVTELIPILDGFDRALKGDHGQAVGEYGQGMLLIRKQLWDVLARHGVTIIDAAGKLFDPHVHEAIERVDSREYADGAIIDVFQGGYQFHGRVLRPAIVRVAVHPDESAEASRREN